MNYQNYIKSKSQKVDYHGFDPVFLPEKAFDFQKDLVTWSVKKGKAAIYADCGLGKTLMQLAFAENIVQKKGGRILILTPIAVGYQTQKEGDKFGINCKISRDGNFDKNDQIVITNYEQIKNFDKNDFVGVVCDESSILKNYKGVRKAEITEFMREMPFRLLCTATAAPNDYIELGTSSECLGELGYMDMLSKFFIHDQKSNHPNRRWNSDGKFRFRGHSQEDFWRWVCSWARAVRKPSDLGYPDGNFTLPEFITKQHIIIANKPRDGYLFDIPSVSLQEQREERSRTVNERCEKAAEIANKLTVPIVVWCNLNKEGDLLQKLIPDAKQVSGQNKDEEKEKIFNDFSNGEVRVIITKPKIGGLGLNWQHCSNQVFFPTHSFEQWYQCVRRSWRFGQKKPVTVDIVTSQGEAKILDNLQRKEKVAETMFTKLVEKMNDHIIIKKDKTYNKKMEVPKWLLQTKK